MVKKFTAKKLLTGIAIPALVITSVVPTAHAANGKYQGEGFSLTYQVINDTEVKIIAMRLEGLTGAYSIKLPETIDGYKVVEFDANAFENFSNQKYYDQYGTYPTNYLAEVIVPNQDIKLGGFVYYSRNHTPIRYKTTLDSGVDVYYAFQYNNVMSNSLNTMALWADYSANPITLDKFEVPETIFGLPTTTLAEFKGMTIGELILPSTVTNTVENAFAKNTIVNKLDTTNLTNLLSVRMNFVNFGGEGSELILGQKALESKYFYSTTQSVYTGIIDKVKLAEEVTNAKLSLFEGGTTVKNLELNEGLETIGTSAFKGIKGLKGLSIPNTVTTINANAFNGIKGLTELVIPNSVTSVGDNAFSNMGTFSQLVIPKNMVSVGVNAFNNGTWFDKVVVMNKYLKYPTGSLPFGLTTTGIALGYVGSTTESAYMGKGFMPLDENQKEPIIASSLVSGQSYKGEVSPSFTIQYADKVTYTLDGKSYDGVSKITGGGQHTLVVTATNDFLTTKKTYTFSIIENKAPEIVSAVPNQTIEIGKLLTVDLKPFFSDPENDKLTYEATTSDEHASEVWVNTKGELKFTSDISDTYEITIKATDGYNYSDPIIFNVDVKDTTVTLPVDPPMEIPAEGGSLNPVTNYKEVINVGLLGIGTSKTIFIDGLLNDFDLDKIVPTFKSTDIDVVNSIYDPVNKTISFESLKAGFSNVQLTIQDDKGNKSALLFMVDVFEKPNTAPNYIANGSIQLGTEAYVVKLDEVYAEASKGESVTYTVSVTKDGAEEKETEKGVSVEEEKLPGVSEKDENTTETETLTTDDSAASPTNNSTSQGGDVPFEEETENPIAIGNLLNRTGYVASLNWMPLIHVASNDTTDTFVFEVPSGVTSTTLHNDENLNIRLVNGKLVVEGKQVGMYNVSVQAETAGGTIPSPVNFALAVLPPNNTGGGTNPGDGGNTGGGTNPGDGGNTGGGTNPGDGGNTGGGTNPGNGGNTNGGSNSDNGSETNPSGELEENDNGDLVLDIKPSKPSINDTVDIVVDKNSIQMMIDGKQYGSTISNGLSSYDKKRVIRDEGKGVYSTVPHYNTDDQKLKITTKKPYGLVITDRVTVPFKDIKGLFSYDEVEDLYNYLIVNGTTASTYSPNKDLKRGEFSAMLARALELSPKNENYQFKDVNVYKKEVQALHEAGIITGFPDGSFGESKTLTRQEAAAMIGRMLNYMGVNTRTIEKISLEDMDRVSDYAKGSVLYLASQDVLVSGQEIKFNPTDNLTRAQMAKILMRSLRLSEWY